MGQLRPLLGEILAGREAATAFFVLHSQVALCMRAAFYEGGRAHRARRMMRKISHTTLFRILRAKLFHGKDRHNKDGICHACPEGNEEGRKESVKGTLALGGRRSRSRETDRSTDRPRDRPRPSPLPPPPPLSSSRWTDGFVCVRRADGAASSKS